MGKISKNKKKKLKKKQKRQAELLERRMLEIEALEREAEIREERAKETGDKGDAEHKLSSPLQQQPPPAPFGPSMALGESDDDDDDEEDGEDEEEEGVERERPIRLTNHTCESLLVNHFQVNMEFSFRCTSLILLQIFSHAHIVKKYIYSCRKMFFTLRYRKKSNLNHTKSCELYVPARFVAVTVCWVKW